jgi:hypothetical protein
MDNAIHPPPGYGYQVCMYACVDVCTPDEANSIFYDLSRKIRNVSTRSIAMSEISNMDDHGDFDNLSSDEAETRTKPRLGLKLSPLEYCTIVHDRCICVL